MIRRAHRLPHLLQKSKPFPFCIFQQNWDSQCLSQSRTPGVLLPFCREQPTWILHLIKDFYYFFVSIMKLITVLLGSLMLNVSISSSLSLFLHYYRQESQLSFHFLPSVNMKKNTTDSVFFKPTSFVNSVRRLVLLPLRCSSWEMQYLYRPKTFNAARCFASVLQRTQLNVLSLDWPLATGFSFRPLAVPQSKKITF